MYNKGDHTGEHFCIVAKGYPTKENPYYTFVDQLVCALADLGIKCTVIAPQSITKKIFRKTPLNPAIWSKETENSNSIDIYQPKFISISDIKLFGYDLGEYFSELLFELAVKKAFRQLKEKPTVMYGHFWNCGLIAADIAYQENLPAFVACGEGEFKIFKINKRKNKLLVDYIKGVVSVSSENKKYSIDHGLVKEENIIVLPNGINKAHFYKMNKEEVRTSLEYKQDDFIVAYAGWFIERKGTKKLSEAIDKLDNVKSIFIGSGNDTPTCKDVLFCGRVPHQDMVKYLNCADVFVLPTLAEGCCNAIIEAMACGLPIISSNLPCNDDILNDNYSIRINPLSVDEIAEAISYLRDNPEVRERMSEAVLQTAAGFSIDVRAKKILDFIMKNKK